MKRLLIIVLTCVWCFLMIFPFSGLPKLGTLLNYSTGFSQIQAPEYTDKPSTSLHYKSYSGSVHIDSIGIPHIFADDDPSVGFLMGYMHARDRYFQMELIVRIVQGKLSELIGEKGKKSDIYWRHFNFDQRYATFWKDSLAGKTKFAHRVEAYAEGVNYYLSKITLQQLPEEYHLLQHTPIRWKPYYTMLLVKYMAHDLSSRRFDNHFQNIIEVLPKSLIKQFYPLQEAYLQPTIPEKTGIHKPNTIEEQWTAHYGKQLSSITKTQHKKIGTEDIIGSNNWVVSGKKSASGKAMLANDMHLRLSLPAPWYEVHIKTPNKHVYGLSLACAPFIVAGHNEAISWGETNASWDLTDFYKLSYTDSSKQHYYKGNEVKPVISVQDTLKIKGEAPYVFTKRFSDFGPILSIDGNELALSWIANNITNEGETFLALETATSFADFEHAFSMYKTPPQNFVYADTSGNIGTHTSGLMWKKKRGYERGIYSTDNPNVQYNGYIPFHLTPSIYNPEKGFIATANQRQIHNSQHYYNWRFSDPYRGYRISEILEKKERLSVSDMRAIQADVTDRSATQLLPILFSSVEEDEDIKRLKNWTFQMKKESIEATIYNAFRLQLFKDFIAFIHNGKTDLYKPQDWTLIYQLITKNQFTANDKTVYRSQLFKTAFTKAISSLESEFGSDRSAWTYGKYHQTSIQHLLRIPAFSEPVFASEGSAYTPNVSKYRLTKHGASQRNIVHMTTPIESYFNIAGGQSGRPSSPNFKNQIKDWKQVSHRKSQFVTSPSQLKSIQFVITLSPEKK